MAPKRLVGSPMFFLTVAGIALVAATAGLMADRGGPGSLAFAALAALVVWRLLSLSVHFEGGELVVRNILKTFRFPAKDVDIRARVVDPRVEYYSSGDSAAYPDIPTAAGDNTPHGAKWYELVYGNDRYQIDALMGRRSTEHERLALEIRHQILAAAPSGDADDSL